MKPKNQILGKSLYAIAFLIVIPVVLWFWAKYTRNLIPFPEIQSRAGGIILLLSGGFLMLWGIVTLIRSGRGLPMNMYPPGLFVSQGPYRLFSHPIYLGFGMLMTGIFLYSGSASGFWLVSPLIQLAMVALVMGYEDIDLKQRFPGIKLKTMMSLPENTAGVPDIRDRLSSLFCIIPPMILGNFIIGKWSGIMEPLLPPILFDTKLENSYLWNLSTVLIIIVPFILNRKDILREWVISGLLSLFYFVFIGILFPSFGSQHLSTPDSFLFCAPVFLIFISLKAIFRQRSWIIAIIFSLLSVFLILVQLNYSRSAPIYLADSFLIFLLSAYYLKIWKFLKDTSEKIANSWKEWIFGKVRVINHGFYVGFGTFFGVLLAGILAGKNYSWAILVFAIMVTICSALWAQLIEGSAKLKRPFGYYGGLIGIIFGGLVVWMMGYNVWVIIGVASVVMPWIQAIGRLRCLVNGCCHGRRTDNELIGIRYFHPRSRVCNISELKGEWVHPTQLYSIVWLFFTGVFLFVLWKSGMSSSFIFGLYLILTGLGRFVEEAYRGEAQTPNVRGLHLYQWTAVISVVAGMIMTIIQVQPAALDPGFSWVSLLVAAFSGTFIFFAMGVDFPYSNVRFSRLV